MRTFLPDPLLGVLAVVGLFGSVIELYWLGNFLLDQFVLQLPAGIETFGDLAHLLADKHPSESRWWRDAASATTDQIEPPNQNPYESPKAGY